MQNVQPDPAATNHPPLKSGGWNLLSLLIGIVVTLVMTVYPHVATRPDGSPDMFSAALLFWAMSAGFVHGLGFIPRLLPLRLLFSLPAIVIALAGAAWRLLGA